MKRIRTGLQVIKLRNQKGLYNNAPELKAEFKKAYNNCLKETENVKDLLDIFRVMEEHNVKLLREANQIIILSDIKEKYNLKMQLISIRRVLEHSEYITRNIKVRNINYYFTFKVEELVNSGVLY